MTKRALITGIAGQDGSYLAEFLLDKGYQVYGMVRRSSVPKYDNIAHILPDITLLDGDLLDQSSLIEVIEAAQPDEIYNLAAQSHVGLSFHQPSATVQITGIGVLRLLEAVRITAGCSTGVRFYQASTSELYGNAVHSPQNEDTPMHPRSPYGCAKLFAHHMVKNYREAYGLFACSGILYNHESPRRGLDFVTRKITDGVAQIACGKKSCIELGNLQARRDWGFAGDYVQAMWLMLQQDQPKDYVIATGEWHSVSEFLIKACVLAGIDVDDGTIILDGEKRPADIDCLCGDASLAREELGWRPRTSFSELVQMMVQEDMRKHATTKSTPEERLVAD